MVAPLGRQVVELLDESSAWADTFGALGQAFRRTPTGGSPVTEMRGLPSINRFLDVGRRRRRARAADRAARRGPRRAWRWSWPSTATSARLDRGVRMRTLYQHTARRSKATRELRGAMREHGAQVRTLDEFFNRLIIIDRRLAMIPGERRRDGLAIHDRRSSPTSPTSSSARGSAARDYEEQGQHLRERHRRRGARSSRCGC